MILQGSPPPSSMQCQPQITPHHVVARRRLSTYCTLPSESSGPKIPIALHLPCIAILARSVLSLNTILGLCRVPLTASSYELGILILLTLVAHAFSESLHSIWVLFPFSISSDSSSSISWAIAWQFSVSRRTVCLGVRWTAIFSMRSPSDGW